MTLSGVLPLWKPEGMTSHDCVAKIRKLFRTKKVGHTGTLDPDVSGVLPLCLGQATRISEYLMNLPKAYEAELTIGIATETEDASGEITETKEVTGLCEQQIREAMEQFTGEIEQLPPMYSAVKVKGKRLYELARKGVSVERKARMVSIYELHILEVDLQKTFPSVRFRVTCSKGTYIRTLCVDIARSLGYPGHMSHLVRTKSGPFRGENCYTLEEIENALQTSKGETLLVPIHEALAHLPYLFLTEQQAILVRNGRELTEKQTEIIKGELYRLFDQTGNFLALYKGSEGGRLKAEKVFVQGEKTR